MPLTFAQKLAQTRTYTTTNQLGVDSQEVYNEGILQALDVLTPTYFENNVQSEIVTTSGSVSDDYFSVSFITSNDFVGTIFTSIIGPNTTINLTAENGANLTGLDYTISVGSITIIRLIRE